MKSSGPSTPRPFDVALDALADRNRRILLIALLEHNPQADDDPQVPDDLDIEVADSESLRLRLRHTHLPRLEEPGFIEWDRETHEIRRGARFDELRPLLELLHTNREELPDGWL